MLISLVAQPVGCRRNIKREKLRGMWSSIDSGRDRAVPWTLTPLSTLIGFWEVLLPGKKLSSAKGRTAEARSLVGA